MRRICLDVSIHAILDKCTNIEHSFHVWYMLCFNVFLLWRPVWPPGFVAYLLLILPALRTPFRTLFIISGMLRTSGGIIDNYYMVRIWRVILLRMVKNSRVHTTQIVVFECCKLFESPRVVYWRLRGPDALCPSFSACRLSQLRTVVTRQTL
jgi:hypothetical protein